MGLRLLADPKTREPIRLRQKCPACEARMAYECTDRRWLCAGCGSWGLIWPKPWRIFTRHERILFRQERRKVELVVRESPAFFDVAKRNPSQQIVLGQVRRERKKAAREVKEAERAHPPA